MFSSLLTAEPDVATTSGAAVEAAGLSRRYGDGDSAVHALRGVSLQVPAGQYTAVMGPSGSGKSTLMHLLAGLDRPTEGRVHVGGADITEMGDNQLTKLRREHVGFVFQAFNLLPTLSAEENIVLPARIAAASSTRPPSTPSSSASGSPSAATTSRRSSPAASSSASRSPGRS